MKIGSALSPAASERRRSARRSHRGRPPGPARDRTPAPPPVGAIASARRTDLEIRARQARPVQPGAQQRRRLAPGLVAAQQAGGVGEQLTGVVEAAVHQVLPEPVAGLGRQGAPGRAAPGRADRRPAATASGMASSAARRDHLLQAVRPVAAAAEQAQDDQPRPADHLLDILVDRQRVAELQEVGEAQARRVLAAAWPGLRRDRRARCPPPTGARCRPGVWPRSIAAPGVLRQSPAGPSADARRRPAISRAERRRSRPDPGRARRSPRADPRAPRPVARRDRNSAGCDRPRPAAPGASACRAPQGSP